MRSEPRPAEAQANGSPPADDATEQTPLLTGSSPEDDAEDVDRPNHAIGPLRAVALCFSLWVLIFLQASNMSGMTMVQGSIAEDLEAYDDAMWLTSSYLIATSSLAPLAGRLATIFAPHALLLPITVLVAAGSLIVSRAETFAVFIFGRVVTGMGAAGVLSLSVIFVLELTSKRRRGLFIGLVNASMTFGVSFGAVVYGAVFPLIGWRPLFWMQCPIAVVTGTAVYLSLPSTMAASGGGKKPGSTFQKLRQIDYLGAFLLTLAIVLFLYGLAGEIQALPLILSPVALAAFLAVEFFVAADPIIPLGILASPGVLLSCFAQLGLMSARWTILFYTPIFMLAVRGAAPAAAGSVLIPTNFGFGLGGLLVGWLHVRRAGAFWLPSLVTFACFAASLYALSLVGTMDAPLPSFVAIVFANGFATGAAMNYTLAHVLHLSRPEDHYITSTLLGTFRGFGGSFGTSIGGGVFYRLLRSSLTEGFLGLDGGDELTPDRRRLVSRLLGTPRLARHGGLSPAETDVAVGSYAGASRGVWQAAATLAVIMILAQAATGWTAPKGEKKGMTEDEARAQALESEGVGEA